MVKIFKDILLSEGKTQKRHDNCLSVYVKGCQVEEALVYFQMTLRVQLPQAETTGR